jgi:hypothetical protein
MGMACDWVNFEGALHWREWSHIIKRERRAVNGPWLYQLVKEVL